MPGPSHMGAPWCPHPDYRYLNSDHPDRIISYQYLIRIISTLIRIIGTLIRVVSYQYLIRIIGTLIRIISTLIRIISTLLVAAPTCKPARVIAR